MPTISALDPGANLLPPPSPPTFNRILIPLDHSPFAEQAIPYAVSIARAAGAAIDLVLVHRIDVTQLAADERAAALDEFAHDEVYLKEQAARIARVAAVTTACTVARGGVSVAIAARAREVGADLIVMASHGRTGLRRLWLGSVADGVMRGAGIPVLLVRAPMPAPSGNDGRLTHSIVVPVDGSLDALGVFDAAAAFARLDGATVHLVRVVRPVPMVTIDPVIGSASAMQAPDERATAALVEDATRELHRAAALLTGAGPLAVRQHVIVHDSVAQAILELVEAQEADLLAMSTHGRGASRLLVGSMADHLLSRSTIPVLLFRPPHHEATSFSDTTFT